MGLQVFRKSGPAITISDLDTLGELFKAGVVDREDLVSENGRPVVRVGVALGESSQTSTTPVSSQPLARKQTAGLKWLEAGLGIGAVSVVVVPMVFSIRACNQPPTPQQLARQVEEKRRAIERAEMLRTALIPSGVAVVYDPDHPNFVTLQYPGPISEYEAKRMAVMAKQKIGGFIKVKDDAGLVRAETSFWD